MKPTIAGLQARIADLEARVIDADQCAARALAARDQSFKECEELERRIRQPGALSPTQQQMEQNYAVVATRADRLAHQVEKYEKVMRLARVLFEDE